MKTTAVFSCVLALAQVSLVGYSHAAEVAECNEQQLLGDLPTRSEQEAHRQFSLPTLVYPHGRGPDQRQMWGLTLLIRVDATGRVACYSLSGFRDREAELNEQRRSLIAQLRQWRYQPFLSNGKAVAMVVTEEIYEMEAPEKHLPLPEVPLEQVQISLRRSGCLGFCPSYEVDVHGDGRVVYTGHQYVDVLGEHTYRIPPERVAGLVESLRAKDIWSLREEYVAGITDVPGYELTLRFGEQVHRVMDYVGHMVGMPKAVSEFEDEIDEVSEAEGFVHLSRAAVERLEAERFEFRSQAGADMLVRAVSNRDSQDNQAMLRLIELGAPVVGGQDPLWTFSVEYRSLLEEALIGQRMELIDPLIQRGALETNGAPDQLKIDAAFQAAVRGGRLQAIEKIWSIAGARAHPSLTFEDVAKDAQSVKKIAPVSLLLRPLWSVEGAKERLAVTKWLVARGCDIKGTGADGDTLLHIAAEVDDVELVRYLLNYGFDPSAPGRYAESALESTRNEDIALLLLEAGADVSKMDPSGESLRRHAQRNRWARVIAWLDAH